jgi:hypothetical protein
MTRKEEYECQAIQLDGGIKIIRAPYLIEAGML